MIFLFSAKAILMNVLLWNSLGQGFGPFGSEIKKGSSSSSSSTSSEPVSPRAPFVVKPPEKKHRLPSAYNRFMKEEIQRIKAANPEIPHREAFSAAAKNVRVIYASSSF
ncbi:hypothetical protein C3L33_13658, partial [Rhododendron williamsianum]